MTTALAAMKGRFGSTDYYVVTMPASEIRTRFVIPNETEDWEDLSIEERYQREIDYKRVAQHMAPYLANDPDRFFGAFIVDVRNSDGIHFEPLADVAKLNPFHASAARGIGFIYLQGNEIMVPLDGQHRLAAIDFAISGKDQKGKAITGISANTDVGNDMCTVILMEHDARKARKIFNKINRYAKPTSKSNNLITADDDPIAIIVRQCVVDELLNQRLVNYESNTLTTKSPEFTTLSSLYEATATMLEAVHGKIDRTKIPVPAEMNLYKAESVEFWKNVFEKIQIFNIALMDHSEESDDKRREVRATYTLGKPIIQQALIEGIVRLRERTEDGTQVSLKEVIDRVNAANWKVDNPLWQGILMNKDRVVTGSAAAKFAARFIGYYLGEPLSETELRILGEQYASKFPTGQEPELPTRLFDPA